MAKMTASKITGERVKAYLKEDKRFDLRKANEFRDLKIETGISINAEGSAKVTLGNTEVLVGIKMNVGTPYPDSGDSGNMMVTAELLPLSSPRYESGPPKFPAIELSRVLDRAVRESKFIDLKKLCIVEGEKVWTIFIDVYSLNDDGNLLDAAGIGIVAALKTAKIPKYDAENEKVLFGEWSDESVPLSKDIPISITVHKIGDSLIVDPTKEEEDLSGTRVTVGSAHGKISSMQKGNSQTFEIEEMGRALDMVNEVYKELFKKIEKQIK
jgi:exosome complex component RRP42